MLTSLNCFEPGCEPGVSGGGHNDSQRFSQDSNNAPSNKQLCREPTLLQSFQQFPFVTPDIHPVRANGFSLVTTVGSICARNCIRRFTPTRSDPSKIGHTPGVVVLGDLACRARGLWRMAEI